MTPPTAEELDRIPEENKKEMRDVVDAAMNKPGGPWDILARDTGFPIPPKKGDWDILCRMIKAERGDKVQYVGWDIYKSPEFFPFLIVGSE